MLGFNGEGFSWDIHTILKKLKMQRGVVFPASPVYSSLGMPVVREKCSDKKLDSHEKRHNAAREPN